MPSPNNLQQMLLCLAAAISIFVVDDFTDHISAGATAQDRPPVSAAKSAHNTATADLIVPVWPNEPPNWNAPEQPEIDTTTEKSELVAGRRLMRLTNVSNPELHVFRPTDTSAKTTVLIAPGGGYSILAWDLEGTEIATWLQSLGVTAVVLKYRVPTRKESKNWLPAVQDLQRSISLIRSDGIPGIPTEHVGVLGFSAGGNASARAAAATGRTYEVIDKLDDTNCIPDFAVLIYPAWLVAQGGELIKDIKITPKTPPMFLAHAANDPVTCLSSVSLFTALKAQDVPSELHVFAAGGHGFGGRTTGRPTDSWRSLCRKWLQHQAWLQQ